MSFKPVKQHRIAVAIVSQLKAAILAGRFAPGERLPTERELTEQFHVSRVVVREAVRELEITGHVKILKGQSGGAYVTGLSAEHLNAAFLDLFRYGKLSVAELIRTRILIEGAMVRTAAEKARPDLARRLAEALAAERHEQPAHADFVSSRIRVHHILAEASGNRLLQTIAGALFRLTGELILAVKPPQKVIHRPEEHEEIIAAVIARRPEQAVAAMQRHLECMGRRLSRLEGAYRRQMTQAG